MHTHQEPEKKSRWKLSALIAALVVLIILLLLLLMRCSPEKKQPAAKAYDAGMTRLDEAQDLSLTTDMRVEFTPEGAAAEELSLTMTTKLHREGEALFMESTNHLVTPGAAAKFGFDVDEKDNAYARYKDEWLYLYSHETEGDGTAQDYTPQTIFAIYTAGRMIVPSNQIKSQTSEPTDDGGTLITQTVDPELALENGNALLGTMGDTVKMVDDLKFSSVVLTMRLDADGVPTEFGTALKFSGTLQDKPTEVVFEAQSHDISYASVEVSYPSDEFLNSLPKAHVEDALRADDDAKSDDTGELSDDEQQALVDSLLPPGATAISDADDSYDITLDPAMPRVDAVTWFKGKLKDAGFTDITAADYKAMNDMNPESLIYEGQTKEGVHIMVLVDEVTNITFK
jgi:hypothetical protein